MPTIEANVRPVVRTVLIVVAVIVCLYVIYLLRTPISWLIVAGFIAVALSGPVNALQRRVRRRGLAIAIVYVTLILIPIGIGAALIPPIVSEGTEFAENVPQYVDELQQYVQENEQLREINEDYDITSKLEEEAAKLPNRIGDATGVLGDIGVGLVNSIFAGVTILVLSIFMVAKGRGWVEGFLRTRNPDQAQRIGRALDHIGAAVGNYVGGALLQAVVAGLTAFLVLTLVGSPFAVPLAVVMFFFDLIPVVGATLGAVLIGITLIFEGLTAVIIWALYSIVYQQVENYMIQPQIQRRATEVDAFVVVVAVLFGATLFGIPGALLAIPTAASIQIAIKEWMAYRRDLAAADAAGDPPPTGPAPEPVP
jgi:predicted PurR-regulated permease PerM